MAGELAIEVRQLVKRFGALPPGEPAGLRRMGAMGETAFYPFLSGQDNLRAAARRCCGRHPDDYVTHVTGDANL